MNIFDKQFLRPGTGNIEEPFSGENRSNFPTCVSVTMESVGPGHVGSNPDLPHSWPISVSFHRIFRWRGHSTQRYCLFTNFLGNGAVVKAHSWC